MSFQGDSLNKSTQHIVRTFFQNIMKINKCFQHISSMEVILASKYVFLKEKINTSLIKISIEKKTHVI